MTESREEGAGVSENPTTSPFAKNQASDAVSSSSSSLLMRFFESEFFDAWIAVSYLHKDLPEQTREYLCQRVYNLPESDVEPYVSQLCQLYVSKGGDDQVEQLLIDLCANSLNIAVKTYWILLAISQDYEVGGGVGDRSAREKTKEIVDSLKDRCELAGLQGHWEIPFKEARLSPVALPSRRHNRFMRGSLDERPVGYGSGLASGVSSVATSGALRALEHLETLETLDASAVDVGANGYLSTVFAVDTGVEGLIYDDGAGGVEVSALSGADMHSPHVDGGILSSPPGGSSPVSGMHASREQAPSSPKRRETTFGATLDFVEALCSVSSALSSVVEGERQWALHKALRNINTEIDRASHGSVAIWFPMARAAPQRLIRLAYRESRLLNSREKAPFTLYVEVLNEDTSVLEASGVLIDSKSRPQSADLELCLQDIQGSLESFTLDYSDSGGSGTPFDARAVAKEAAAAGIQWMPQHHRKSSSTDFATNSLDASIALQAVKASSAAQKAHMPPILNDSLQLTPSIQSQRSDVSMLSMLASPSPAGRSRDGSPEKRSEGCGTGIGHGNGHGNGQSSAITPTIAGTAPQMGGGTWIGKMSQNLRQTSMSSPRIQAALDEIRGEGPAVRVRLHLDMVPSAETSKSARVDGDVQTKQCVSSTIWCSIGLCRCPKREEPAAPTPTPVVRTTPRVRVELIVRGGLDLSIKRPRHKRMPSQEALMHIAQQHKLTPPTATMATIESGAVYHGDERERERERPRDGEADDVARGWQRSASAPGSASGSVDGSAAGSPAQNANHANGDVAGTSDSEATPTGPVNSKNRDDNKEKGNAGVATPASVPNAGVTDVYGEKWANRKERIRKRSPHGARAGWDLAAVIVKDGDDCRQELLSMQLIRTFQSIFEEAGLPLWLRPYDILVTSNLTALIEMIPNAPSIHNVKSSFSEQDMTLRKHFLEKYGRDGKRTPEFDAAQNNFVESSAAYSLLCYVLQIRDRHNGNVLLDDEGHVIHIDFGFMLSNSPGGVNFESAPFKLTREFLEVMDSDSDGTSSKAFDYFKLLMIQGFIAICKHADRIIELVSMMSESGCPCFRNKQLAVEGLRKRISTPMSEEKYVEYVLGLIGDALDNWRTRQYDYYQRVLNGIQ